MRFPSYGKDIRSGQAVPLTKKIWCLLDLNYGEGVDLDTKTTHEVPEKMKSETSFETSFETTLKQVLKPKEYEKIKDVITKLEEEKAIKIQDVMSITHKSRTTAWRYMQRLVEAGFVVTDGKTNNVVYYLNEDMKL